MGPTLWPQLGRFWIGPRTSHPLEAWTEVIYLIREFRQGSGIGRNPGTERNRPGRSRWPEADSIRNTTGAHLRRHAPEPHIPRDAFPRAEFGLPIVFHFKDGPRGFNGPPRERSAFDPLDTELYPMLGSEQKGRMASPLILKPLALSSDEALPMILKLNAPQPTGLALVGKAYATCSYSDDSIHNPKFAEYRYSPMGGGRSPAGSALEAFLAFAEEKGYTEVVL
jgi:CRISPR-associated protein Cmr1